MEIIYGITQYRPELEVRLEWIEPHISFWTRAWGIIRESAIVAFIGLLFATSVTLAVTSIARLVIGQ